MRADSSTNLSSSTPRGGTKPVPRTPGSRTLSGERPSVRSETPSGAEMDAVIRLRDRGALGEEVVRRIQRELGLEELRLRG